LSAEPDVIQRERAETQLCYEHRTGFMQALHNDRVFCGYSITERLSAISRRDSLGVDQVLGTPGDPMQRPSVLAYADFFVSSFGLR